MSKRRLALRVTAVCTAVLSAAAVTAGPASAAPEQCQPGYFCMWGDSSYRGLFYSLGNADSPNFRGFNDHMTSYWNRSDHTYHVFKDIDYGGTCLLTIAPGASSAAVKDWQNDVASSARRRVPEDIRNFCQG